jgi:hypothetical protein
MLCGCPFGFWITQPKLTRKLCHCRPPEHHNFQFPIINNNTAEAETDEVGVSPVPLNIGSRSTIINLKKNTQRLFKVILCERTTQCLHKIYIQLLVWKQMEKKKKNGGSDGNDDDNNLWHVHFCFSTFYSMMLSGSVSIIFYSWIVDVCYPDITLTTYNLQHWKSMQQERFYEFYSEFTQ